MNNYEFMMIVSPSLSDEARTSLISSIEADITADGTKILSTDHWGVRDLAYTIRGSDTGYYVLYTLESTGHAFTSVTEGFNIRKDLWRFMFSKIEA
jgi:small subunit ribosomal protein S6